MLYAQNGTTKDLSMSTLTLDGIPEYKMRLVHSYVARHGLSLSNVLLNNSIDNIVASEANNALASLLASGELPEELIRSAESSAVAKPGM